MARGAPAAQSRLTRCLASPAERLGGLIAGALLRMVGGALHASRHLGLAVLVAAGHVARVGRGLGADVRHAGGLSQIGVAVLVCLALASMLAGRASVARAGEERAEPASAAPASGDGAASRRLERAAGRDDGIPVRVVPRPSASQVAAAPTVVAAGTLSPGARIPAEPANISLAPGERLTHLPHPGPVTGPYGEPRASHRHTGIDFDGETGDPVVAAGPGTVVATGYLPDYRGYGIVVMIDHGSVETLYAHLSSTAVAVGQMVAGGDAVGAMGTTGSVTGSHLHFEVRQGGQPVDPHPWLPR